MFPELVVLGQDDVGLSSGFRSPGNRLAYHVFCGIVLLLIAKELYTVFSKVVAFCFCFLPSLDFSLFFPRFLSRFF